MELPDEILRHIQLLIDKPTSPLVNKELHSLLIKQNLPLEKTLHFISIKFRADLIIFLLENNRYPSQSIIDTILSFIVENVVSFKIAEVIQLFILVLSHIEENEKCLEIGYSQIIKLAIKKANLEVKEKLFMVILSNCEFLYKKKRKKIILAIVCNFVEIFKKFLIYVPSFINLVSFCLEVDYHSKKVMNKEHPEKEEKLEEIFIDFSSQELSSIKNILLTILENTKEKLNSYSLHKNCLIALKKIGIELNEFKIKESELLFTETEVSKVCRLIDLYIDRKGTIDEARLAKAEWMKRYQSLQKIKQLKTEKQQNPTNKIDYLSEKPEFIKPLMIEEVISMTNNYRLKYQVSPNEVENSQIVQVTNNFLKKGGGVGGGRTYLLEDKKKKVDNSKKEGNEKQLYEKIVDQCFLQCAQDLSYKSFVDFKFENEGGVCGEKMREFEVLKGKQFEINNELGNEEDFNSMGAKSENLNRSISTNSMIEDDEEVEEICNLIDLAYSFKFS